MFRVNNTYAKEIIDFSHMQLLKKRETLNSRTRIVKYCTKLYYLQYYVETGLKELMNK